MSDQNPFISASLLKDAIPYDRIRIEDYEPAFRAALSAAQSAVQQIIDNPDTPDFSNTIEPLERMGFALNLILETLDNHVSVNLSDEASAVQAELQPLYTGFINDVYTNQALFERVKTVCDARDGLGLAQDQQLLLQATYRKFEKNGISLPPQARGRVKEIIGRLSVLSNQFANNVVKSRAAFALVLDNPDDFSGLPQDVIDIAAEKAFKKGHAGKWLFTLDSGCVFPILTHCDNQDLREKIWRGLWTIATEAPFDNRPLILETVALRDELAKALGYKNYFAYEVADRMALTPERVDVFLERLKNAYKAVALEEMEVLRSAAGEAGIDELQPWDTTYLAEKMTRRHFDYDSKVLRPYLPFDRVLDGVKEHFGRLFNIEFRPVETNAVWHPDVLVFDIVDKADGAVLGTLHGDFYSRDTKRSGAWMHNLRDQHVAADGTGVKPIVGVYCNFSKPAGGGAAQLDVDNLRSFFHEMGHGLHSLLSKVRYGSQAGVNVRWDFVEVPSQLQEYFLSEQETLALVSRHADTGQAIPAELVQKIKDSKNYLIARGELAHTARGILDLAWHTANPAAIYDVEAFEAQALAETRMFAGAAAMSPSFTHIFGGSYAAAYYSYQWANVMAADMYGAFERAGLYDAATAARYRAIILEKGGSEDPNVLFNRFMGREPDADALLRHQGILPSGLKLSGPK